RGLRVRLAVSRRRASRSRSTRLAAFASATAVTVFFIGSASGAGDALDRSLTGAPGDPARGRAIVLNRQVGLCLLCHSGPFPEERVQGNIPPDMKGAGSRWSEGQLRLRIVDPAQINPATILPENHRH